MKRSLQVFFLGLLTILVVLEISLRIFGFFYKEGRAVPGRNHSQKNDNTFVILCLGNSFTLGVGAPPGESYPDHLQNMFRERVDGRDVVVINRGRGGENTAELLEGLGRTLVETKPDLVVLQTGDPNSWNFYKYRNYLERISTDQGSRKGAVYALNDFLYKSRAYRLVSLLRDQIRLKTQENALVPYNYRRQKEYVDLVKLVRARDKEFFSDDKKVQMAMDVFRKGIEIEPKYPQNYDSLGRIYLYQMQYDRAQKFFQKAFALDPGYIYKEGKEYRDLERWVNALQESSVVDEQKAARAIAVFKRGVEIDPRYPPNYCSIGVIYLYQKKYDEALEWLIKSILVGPDFRAGYENKGYKYIRRMKDMLIGNDEEPVRKKLDDFVNTFKKTHPENVFFLDRQAISEWTESDILEIVRIIRSMKIGMILQNYPHKARSKRNPVDDILENVAARFNIPFIDNEGIFKKMMTGGPKDDAKYFSPDGHCNSLGYKAMAANVYNKIVDEKILRINE